MTRRLFLPALASPLLAQTPPMYFGDTSRIGRPFAKDPSVVFFRNRYLLYFSLPAPGKEFLGNAPGAPGWAIGIAESRDLINWRKIAELTPDPNAPHEKNGVCAPGARVLNNRVHLFYQTYGNGPKDAICHASSADGLTFERNPTNPIFHPTGPWTAGRAIDAELIPFNGRMFLYAATRDPDMKIQMLTGAFSDPKANFVRNSWTQIGNGPILKPELPWERECIEAATCLVRNRQMYMFYAGGYNNQPQQIGCAVSRDGLSFTRLFQQPLVPNGPPGSWNSSESGHPGVLVTPDKRTLLFYQGNNDNGKTWYLSYVEIGWRGNLPYVKT